MKDANRLPRIDKDQELIDRMIDWRRINRPQDESEIKTSLSPKELHKALGFPEPRDGNYPLSVLYRGFRVSAAKSLSAR
jgi:hypothetical protein